MTSPNYRSAAGERAVMALYDRALERWPVPHESLLLPTRHGETFVVTCGEHAAPPLILLHGAGTNSSMWAGDVAAYAARFRVYAADLPGEAGKSSANRPDWKSPAFAEWVEDVLNSLGLERASMVGVSQGGWTAVKFAVAHPARVERLALISPGGIIRDRLSFALKAIPLSLLGRRGQRRLSRLLFGDQPVTAEVKEGSGIVLRHFKPRVGILPIFSDDELRKLDMPVLLIGGRRDALRDMSKIAGRLRPLLPRLEVRLVEGAGHAVLGTSGLVLPFLLGEAAPEPAAF